MATTTADALHPAPRDHLAKLHRVATRIADEGMHRDEFDDFCKTAWHLIELVEKDPSSSPGMRRQAALLRRDHDLAVCEYLANTAKHGQSRPKTATRARFSVVEISVGFGRGRFGKGPFGIGEQSITIRFSDGTETNALDLVGRIIAKWDAIL